MQRNEMNKETNMLKKEELSKDNKIVKNKLTEERKHKRQQDGATGS